MNPQDPLAQLRDIHLPEPVSWWPLAIGWWVLALALTLILIAALVMLLRRHRRRRARRKALRELKTLAQQRGQLDTGTWLAAISSLLRRYALTHWPRPQVAGLAGRQWFLFLRQHAKNNVSENALQQIAEHYYLPDPDVEHSEIVKAARQWLCNASPGGAS